MDDESITISGGPLKGTLRGLSAIYLAVLAAALGMTIYILWSDVRENRDLSHDEHVTIQQGVDEMVYVQSLSEKEREKLNLTMPETLARKRRSAWAPQP